LFTLAWLIAGSIWIFGAKNNGVQGSDPNNRMTYCQSNLFDVAFRLLIINYCIYGIAILAFFLRNICHKRDKIAQPNIVIYSLPNRT
jgi:hypothetical protein